MVKEVENIFKADNSSFNVFTYKKSRTQCKKMDKNMRKEFTKMQMWWPNIFTAMLEFTRSQGNANLVNSGLKYIHQIGKN